MPKLTWCHVFLFLEQETIGTKSWAVPILEHARSYCFCRVIPACISSFFVYAVFLLSFVILFSYCVTLEICLRLTPHFFVSPAPSFRCIGSVIPCASCSERVASWAPSANKIWLCASKWGSKTRKYCRYKWIYPKMKIWTWEFRRAPIRSGDPVSNGMVSEVIPFTAGCNSGSPLVSMETKYPVPKKYRGGRANLPLPVAIVPVFYKVSGSFHNLHTFNSWNSVFGECQWYKTYIASHREKESAVGSPDLKKPRRKNTSPVVCRSKLMWPFEETNTPEPKLAMRFSIKLV